MKESLRRWREIEARTWTVGDERRASKIALAFKRFREVVGNDTAAAMLVSAWVHTSVETDEFDTRPFNAE